MAEKKLIIVESPTKAKTIKKYLPKECTVIASKGHIRDLPEGELGIDIENSFKPKYVISKGKKPIVKALKDELKDSTELILATDEDREGESISWHLLEILKPKIPYKRMVFHEITKKAILKAFENGRDLDLDLVHSQEARRILDRLYGFTVSPVLWKKLSNKKLAAGRVQSPGLKMIVERERERMAFKKNSYWDIQSLLSSSKEFEAKLSKVNGTRVANGKDFDSVTGDFKSKGKSVLLDEETTKKYVDDFKSDSVWTVTNINQRKVTQKPSIPFTTSTLQQEANRKLKLTARKTMSLAQSLYEEGLITYMRTDSPTLSQEGTMAARKEIEELYGKEYLSEKPRYFSATSANAQEAHEAIRPSGEIFKKPEETGLSGQNFSLYKLIWMRTISCQMADARKLNTTVTIEAKKNKEILTFTSTGVQIEFPGFIRAYVEGSDDVEATLENKEKYLPSLKENEVLKCLDLKGVSHETKAPSRFSEAALVQNLEKQGIGRPSTYATIIERITNKNYVIKRDGVLVPTFIGFGVVSLLEKNFSSYIDYGFTKEMEDSLDRISSDKIEEFSYIKAFYEGEKGLSSQVEKAMKDIEPTEAKKLMLPQISEENQIYLGPYGAYVKGEKNIGIPETFVPGEITNQDIIDIKNKALSTNGENSGPIEIGKDEKSGKAVYYCTGKFGPYWQIGEIEGKKKPPRFSVPKDLRDTDVAFEKIMQFFSLPKVLGKNEEGKDVSIGSGKFGPYVVCEKDFRSVPNFEVLFNMTLERAIEILSQPKPGRKSKGASTKAKVPVVDLGEHEGEALGIFYGRYGYYMKHGKKNIALPKEYKNDEEKCKTLKKEDAISFIEEK
ncbi:MAG: type I DNA topoisomerase [Sphaerochaetaceae bacterium]